MEQVQIEVLEGLEAVRKRKEMYLMDKNHAVFEIIDNAVDEYAAGYCTAIAIGMIGDTIVIEDNGRGMPITPHPSPKYKGLTQAEVAYTVLHAGGKFNNANSYKVATGGLNGVGAACVNAVSSELDLIIYNNSKKYKAHFEKGKIIEPMQIVEENIENKTGTEVHFKLDDEIWKDEDFNLKKIKKRIQQLSYLNPGLLFYLVLDTTDKEGNVYKSQEQFYHPEGLTAYVDKITANKKKLINNVSYAEIVDDISIAFSFSYTDYYSQDIYSFCNNIYTESGGDHLTGFKSGIYEAISNYALETKAIKDSNEIESNDTREGIVGILSVKVKEPKFEGQGKSKLKMKEVRSTVKQTTKKFFYEYLNKNPDEAQAIIEKTLIAAKSRIAAKKARETVKKKQQIMDTSGLSGKLANCQSDKPEKCEIFLVEGDSAGGSAKQARDRKTQAVLPVFGKILNVEKTNTHKVLTSEKLIDMLKALRCGIGDDFDIDRLRYHKIILMSDADVDGYHIQCLNMTLFYRYLKPIIDKGYLYIAVPPLYKLQKGKEIIYLYNDKELSEFDTDGYSIQRYKGLGEMNADQLWETTMNPETRKLIQVVINDIETADETFSIYMGDNTQLRKEILFNNLG